MVDALHDDAVRLVELYDERVQLTHRNARSEHLTSPMVLEVCAVGDRLDEACEAFRRRHFPRRGRVCVGLWTVMTVSPTGRRTHVVLDLFSRYQPA